MPLRDDDISDWSTTASENPPEDGTLIGRNLAGQWRNLKSVARSESLNKQWIKLSPTITTTSATARFTATFGTADGNLTTYFPVSRKVRLVPTSGEGTIYCGVIGSSYVSATTLTLIALDGAPENSTEYSVSIGTEDPSKSHLPVYGQEASTLTISGASTSGTATIARSEPDKAYFVKTTIISCNSAVSGADIVTGVTKNNLNFVVTIAAAPGGATQTVIGCTVFREM